MLPRDATDPTKAFSGILGSVNGETHSRRAASGADTGCVQKYRSPKSQAGLQSALGGVGVRFCEAHRSGP